HIPGVFTESLEFFSPEELGYKYKLTNQKVMINVGSVGQPRNNDPRSSYVTLDGGNVEFHRVAYDMEKTIEKIYAIPELDNFLGDRLREGR
ncbi:MAG: metallophosphoesterase family protein, partial [Planctomycetota bacterium]